MPAFSVSLIPYILLPEQILVIVPLLKSQIVPPLKWFSFHSLYSGRVFKLLGLVSPASPANAVNTLPDLSGT